MQRRKFHCPEADVECTDVNCSIKICVRRQAKELRQQKEDELLARRRQLVRREAALRAIRGFFADHNVEIGAGRPGIVKKVGGTLLLTRVDLPKGGRDQNKLIDQLLRSKNPDLVARFERETNALVNERWGVAGPFVIVVPPR